MSIKKQFILMISVFMFLVVFITGYSFFLYQEKMDKNLSSFLADNQEQQDQQPIMDINIPLTLTKQVEVVDDEINRNMLNVAYLIKNLDSKNNTELDLTKIAQETGMSGIIITNFNGELVSSTDSSFIGANLLDIREKYEPLLLNRKDAVSLPFQVNTETGEIFKRVAIPRENHDGIIEVSLHISAMNQSLESILDEINNVEIMYLLDSNGIVLFKYGKKPASNNLNVGDQSAFGDEKNLYHVEKNEKNMYTLYISTKENNTTINQPLEIPTELTKPTIINTVVSLVIVFLVLMNIVFVFINSKLNPLSRLVKNAEKLAEGNFSLDGIETNGKGEIYLLAQKLNKIADTMKTKEQETKEFIEKSRHPSDSQQELIEKTKEITKEIRLFINELDSLSENQLQNANQNRDLINNTQEHTQRFQTLADELAHSTKELENHITDGKEQIRETVEQIEAVSDSLHDTSSWVSSLKQHSSKIETFTNTITAIAKQTELLAINASIESARAGEQGRGFKVVADEVKKLAEQSSLSAKEITSLVSHIQKTTDQASLSIGKTNEEIKKGSKSVQDISDLFEEFSMNTSALQTQMELGHTTAKEITETVDKVHTSIKEFSEEQIMQIEELAKKIHTLEQISTEE